MSGTSATIGIALSGGGHRATLFGLGALLYLADAGLNRQVRTISSVSGGSLLNAYVALLDEPFDRIAPNEFERATARLAATIAGSPARWRTAVVLTVAGLLLLLSLFETGYLHGLATLVAFAALLLPVCFLLGPRSGGSLWGFWGTWAYCGSLVWGLLALRVWWVGREPIARFARATVAVYLPVTTALPQDWLWSVGLLVLSAAWGAASNQRHAVAAGALGHTLLRLPKRCSAGKTRPARLEDMHGGGSDDLRHVVCATEMHAGNHAYFSHDVVYSRGFGLGKPGGLPLRTAVQASANFPGGFPLRPIDAWRFEFSVPDSQALRGSGEMFAGRWMVLSDGGVFDNLADAWYLEASDRAERLEAVLSRRWAMEEERVIGRYRGMDEVPDDLAERVEKRRKAFEERHADAVDRIEAIKKVPDCLVVVNAGTAIPWQRLARAWIPLLGEVLGFVKISSVMYNNTTTQRVRDLRVRFANGQPPGVVVDMAENPSDVWDYDDRGVNMQEFWGKLRLDQEGDSPFVASKKSRGVRTTLLPLGVDVTAHLLYHGYVQARATLYAKLGYEPVHGAAKLEDFWLLARGKLRNHSRPNDTTVQAIL